MRVTVKLYATLGDYLPAGSKHNRAESEVAETAAVDTVLAPLAYSSRFFSSRWSFLGSSFNTA